MRLNQVAGKKFLVLGLGRSGRASYQSLIESGAQAVAWDDSEQSRESASDDGLELADPCVPGTLDSVEAVVLSPGIPHLYPKPSKSVAAALAEGIPLDNDIGLFFASAKKQRAAAGEKRPLVIAVTGSNGKSTTASLIHHLLSRNGRSSCLAGNIGNAVLGMTSVSPIVVLEVSSYQTEVARCLDPDVAIFLNFSPDHLDRHAGIGGYLAAKMRLFSGASLAHAVVGVDEIEGQYLAARVSGRPGSRRVTRVSAGIRENTAPGTVKFHGSVLDAHLDGDDPGVFDISGCQSLRGDHNLQNAGAAFAACRGLGLTSSEFLSTIESFPGLEHRMQRLGTIRGIQFVNDSKATNSDSADKALGSYARIRWIAGGLGKEGGLALSDSSLSNVAKAYLIGSSAPDFAKQLSMLDCETLDDLASAVRRAFEESKPGDTILLSPAAASFDQYCDFEERGDHFISEFQKLLQASGGGCET